MLKNTKIQAKCRKHRKSTKITKNPQNPAISRKLTKNPQKTTNPTKTYSRHITNLLHSTQNNQKPVLYQPQTLSKSHKTKQPKYNKLPGKPKITQNRKFDNPQQVHQKPNNITNT